MVDSQYQKNLPQDKYYLLANKQPSLLSLETFGLRQVNGSNSGAESPAPSVSTSAVKILDQERSVKSKKQELVKTPVRQLSTIREEGKR